MFDGYVGSVVQVIGRNEETSVGLRIISRREKTFKEDRMNTNEPMEEIQGEVFGAFLERAKEMNWDVDSNEKHGSWVLSVHLVDTVDEVDPRWEVALGMLKSFAEKFGENASPPTMESFGADNRWVEMYIHPHWMLR